MLAGSVAGLALFGACLALNVFILARGLAAGIEVVARYGTLLLLGLAVLLAVRAVLITPVSDSNAQASAFEGLSFAFRPREPARLTNPAVWLAAAEQVFFALSLGVGTIACYASYLGEHDNLVGPAAATFGLN